MFKNFVLSKTLWFNALTGLVWLSGALLDLLTAHPYLIVTLVIIQTVGNGILRIATKTGLKLKN